MIVVAEGVRSIEIRGSLAPNLEALAPELRLAAGLWHDTDPPHVWVCDLRATLDSSLPYRSQERDASRLVVSELIAAYAPWMRPPDSAGFHFVNRPGGKPKAVTADLKCEFYSFNYSHSYGLLAIAIAPHKSRHYEVGVDLEVWTNDAGRSEHQLQEWVRQEAALKCVGVGITMSVNTPDIAAALSKVTVDQPLPLRHRSREAGQPQFTLARAWNW